MPCRRYVTVEGFTMRSGQRFAVSGQQILRAAGDAAPRSHRIANIKSESELAVVSWAFHLSLFVHRAGVQRARQEAAAPQLLSSGTSGITYYVILNTA